MRYCFRLEAKLNKRRARVEDMKNQAQEVQMSQKKDKEKQMAQLVGSVVHVYVLGQ